MVSFFGFKIGGGDKKKKLANEAVASSNQQRRKLEQDAVAGRQDGKGAPNGTVYSVSRPDTSHTCKITATQPGASPYGSKSSPAAMSLSELTDSIHPNLRQWVSNPNLGSNRFDASTSDLAAVPPVPVRNPSRPATPVEKKTAWMNPLDMHSTRGPTMSALSASRSPLDQFGLKLDIPNDQAPIQRNDESPKAPMPLRVNKSSPQTAESPKMFQSPIKPPSPPQSVKDMENHSPVRGRPAFRDDMFRSPSRGSQRNGTTNLKEVQNAWDMPRRGPASIPSPVSTPRGSEETPTNNSMNMWCDPVIRSVAARRDTMTSITHHKVSMQIKLEDLESAFMDEPEEFLPPQMPGSQMRQLVRPPPLNLDPRPRTPDRAGTYPPAPFMMDQRPHTPTGESSRRPMKERAGPPPGAIGAHGRPGRPNTKNVRRPAADEYVIQPSSQPQSRRASQDSSRPTSPDSPLLPQSGPLASPRFLPIDAQLAPPPLKEARSNLHIATFALDDDVDDQLTAPCMGHRNAPTPDSSQWPMPSPTESTFDAALSYRGESPFVGADSPLETPPRVLPQGVVGRSESPFGFRSFNFSRPMTPTLEQPPLRRDETPLSGRVQRYQPKRSETVPVSPGFRDYDSSPSPGIPPPRANTVTVNVGHGMGHGLRSPAIVGDDFGGGFI
ncbi:uncharacterized protein GGS22DRAFT_166364 [Annulohypoxylon maeteangense]|uniref:uncharacterized protein n=1 Tax=Annulohypoxylon maeteangense TaxID=1927788 RepID=UPI00200889B9|nr:uncharacterized protein GGS22DRAFT_166364 [Annulohypoxylon maeteangense]KAI0883903.1 hypothetical protein GGS22DRAFT_166364 [Annulohypoxylon maeteangense]